MTAGTLDVLSTGRGHLRLEVERDGADKVRAVITDLLARGASIFVETDDGETRRVKRFDPHRMVYLVDDGDALEALGTLAGDESKRPARKATRKKPVKVAEARATGVNRTAGG